MRELVLVVALGAAADVSAEPLSAERESEIRHLVKHDCGSCHGMTLKGGLGPALLPPMLAGKDERALAEIVLEGVPGTPMAPWKIDLSAGEARWLVSQLKNGTLP